MIIKMHPEVQKTRRFEEPSKPPSTAEAPCLKKKALAYMLLFQGIYAQLILRKGLAEVMPWHQDK